MADEAVPKHIVFVGGAVADVFVNKACGITGIIEVGAERQRRTKVVGLCVVSCSAVSSLLFV